MRIGGADDNIRIAIAIEVANSEVARAEDRSILRSRRESPIAIAKVDRDRELGTINGGDIDLVVMIEVGRNQAVGRAELDAGFQREVPRAVAQKDVTRAGRDIGIAAAKVRDHRRYRHVKLSQGG